MGRGQEAQELLRPTPHCAFSDTVTATPPSYLIRYPPFFLRVELENPADQRSVMSSRSHRWQKGAGTGMWICLTTVIMLLYPR